MKEIEFRNYCPEKLDLIDLETVPFHMQDDYFRRNENIKAGYILCSKCDGTGNEFFSMYRACPTCGGTGRN